MHRDQLTGLVLAGGQSRRFGSDKALYEVAGRRMVDHVLDAVRPLVSELLLSVRSASAAPEAIAARVIEDRYADRGPLAGLHAGLAESTRPWTLVVAGDMPYVTTAALEYLVARCEGDAVVGVGSDGRRHPLCACYRRSLLPAVERRLSTGDFSMHGFLDTISVVDVTLPDAVLRNVNAPSDLR